MFKHSKLKLSWSTVLFICTNLFSSLQTLYISKHMLPALRLKYYLYLPVVASIFCKHNIAGQCRFMSEAQSWYLVLAQKVSESCSLVKLSVKWSNISVHQPALIGLTVNGSLAALASIHFMRWWLLQVRHVIDLVYTAMGFCSPVWNPCLT